MAPKQAKRLKVSDHSCYFGDFERFSQVDQMLEFSKQTLERLWIPKNLDKIKTHYDNWIKRLPNKEQSVGFVEDDEEYSFLKEAGNEHKYDQIYWSLVFEHYIKAKLLYKGYLIHLVNPRKDLSLRDKQKDSPLTLKDFLSQNEFEHKESRKETFLTLRDGKRKVERVNTQYTRDLPKLTHRTIAVLAVLENNKYRTLLDIPDKICVPIEKIIKNRNRLTHFKSWVGVVWHVELENNKALYKFFSTNIPKLRAKVRTSLTKKSS